ncbi:tail fiber domain-containing protein [Spirosoma koreense]
MKQVVFATLLLGSSAKLFAQVGIGTTTPKAFFNVADGKDVLFGPDVSGSGKKLIWYASKGAFRAGQVLASQWDNAQVGLYSVATGYNTVASGQASTAMGFGSTASGYMATALGSSSASGTSSVAIGSNNSATGGYSTAMGYTVNASGDNSMAFGTYVSTGGYTGSFILGDYVPNASTLYTNSAFAQLMMRFSGGYMLYTTAPSNQNSAIGVKLAAGGNAWTTISDSTRKEHFRKANGALFLRKIAGMRLGSWNYKGQDARLYRHYGPMAQDFFAAFGHDQLGTIGEDKSINQADFDGVNLIAIQALIKEVEKLEAENNILRGENTALKQDTASLKSDMEQVKKQLTILLKQ